MAKHWTYRQEAVKCGKPTCKRCPHGPYWYRYSYSKGKTTKEYVGKNRPQDGPQREGDEPYEDCWKDILNKRTATVLLACDILGVSTDTAKETVKRAFRSLALLHHPDRGGSHEMAVIVIAAWDHLCEVRGWK
jgi:hypothetical protein